MAKGGSPLLHYLPMIWIKNIFQDGTREKIQGNEGQIKGIRRRGENRFSVSPGRGNRDGQPGRATGTGDAKQVSYLTKVIVLWSGITRINPQRKKPKNPDGPDVPSTPLLKIFPFPLRAGHRKMGVLPIAYFYETLENAFVFFVSSVHTKKLCYELRSCIQIAVRLYD